MTGPSGSARTPLQVITDGLIESPAYSCPVCEGTGAIRGLECEDCNGAGYVNDGEVNDTAAFLANYLEAAGLLLTPEREADRRRAALHDGYVLGYHHALDDQAGRPRDTCMCPLVDARSFGVDPELPQLRLSGYRLCPIHGPCSCLNNTTSRGGTKWTDLSCPQHGGRQ